MKEGSGLFSKAIASVVMVGLVLQTAVPLSAVAPKQTSSQFQTRSLTLGTPLPQKTTVTSDSTLRQFSQEEKATYLKNLKALMASVSQSERKIYQKAYNFLKRTEYYGPLFSEGKLYVLMTYQARDKQQVYFLEYVPAGNSETSAVGSAHMLRFYESLIQPRGKVAEYLSSLAGYQLTDADKRYLLENRIPLDNWPKGKSFTFPVDEQKQEEFLEKFGKVFEKASETQGDIYEIFQIEAEQRTVDQTKFVELFQEVVRFVEGTLASNKDFESAVNGASEPNKLTILSNALGEDTRYILRLVAEIVKSVQDGVEAGLPLEEIVRTVQNEFASRHLGREAKAAAFVKKLLDRILVGLYTGRFVESVLEAMAYHAWTNLHLPAEERYNEEDGYFKLETYNPSKHGKTHFRIFGRAFPKKWFYIGGTLLVIALAGGGYAVYAKVHQDHSHSGGGGSVSVTPSSLPSFTVTFSPSRPPSHTTIFSQSLSPSATPTPSPSPPIDPRYSNAIWEGTLLSIGLLAPLSSDSEFYNSYAISKHGFPKLQSKEIYNNTVRFYDVAKEIIVNSQDKPFIDNKAKVDQIEHAVLSGSLSGIYRTSAGELHPVLKPLFLNGVEIQPYLQPKDLIAVSTAMRLEGRTDAADLLFKSLLYEHINIEMRDGKFYTYVAVTPYPGNAPNTEDMFDLIQLLVHTPNWRELFRQMSLTHHPYEFLLGIKNFLADHYVPGKGMLYWKNDIRTATKPTLRLGTQWSASNRWPSKLQELLPVSSTAEVMTILENLEGGLKEVTLNHIWVFSDTQERNNKTVVGPYFYTDGKSEEDNVYFEGMVDWLTLLVQLKLRTPNATELERIKAMEGRLSHAKERAEYWTQRSFFPIGMGKNLSQDPWGNAINSNGTTLGTYYSGVTALINRQLNETEGYTFDSFNMDAPALIPPPEFKPMTPKRVGQFNKVVFQFVKLFNEAIRKDDWKTQSRLQDEFEHFLVREDPGMGKYFRQNVLKGQKYNDWVGTVREMSLYATSSAASGMFGDASQLFTIFTALSGSLAVLLFPLFQEAFFWRSHPLPKEDDNEKNVFDESEEEEDLQREFDEFFAQTWKDKVQFAEKYVNNNQDPNPVYPPLLSSKTEDKKAFIFRVQTTRGLLFLHQLLENFRPYEKSIERVIIIVPAYVKEDFSNQFSNLGVLQIYSLREWKDQSSTVKHPGVPELVYWNNRDRFPIIYSRRRDQQYKKKNLIIIRKGGVDGLSSRIKPGENPSILWVREAKIASYSA